MSTLPQDSVLLAACPCTLLHIWLCEEVGVACVQFIAVGICVGFYYAATFCSRYIWEVAEYCDCLGLDRTDDRVHASQKYLERLKWRCAAEPWLLGCLQKFLHSDWLQESCLRWAWHPALILNN